MTGEFVRLDIYAKAHDISPRTLKRWADLGQFPHALKDGKYCWLSRSDADAALRRKFAGLASLQTVPVSGRVRGPDGRYLKPVGSVGDDSSDTCETSAASSGRQTA